MKLGKILAATVPVLLLCGCRLMAVPDPLTPVVTQIHTEKSDRQEPLAHSVHTAVTNEDTSQILTYLRLVKPQAEAPVNPELVKGPMYTITLQRSDGSTVTYRQKAEKYFCTPEGCWHRIDPSLGACLEYLLESLMS